VKNYFVSRWGNPEDGPNGPDTNFLVWANTRDEAAALVDALLPEFPHINGPNVASFCHLVIELGSATLYGMVSPNVIHGPWVAHAILRGGDPVQLSWRREEPDGVWDSAPGPLSDDEPTLPHSDPPGPPDEDSDL
jgi:hypothetical protein